MKNRIILFAALMVFSLKNQAQTVTDVDGNVYNTITFGTQTWMAENLKATHYSNNDLIGTTSPSTLDINSESSPKYQWAYEGNESQVALNGRLYTWYAATDSRNICPVDWHVPSDGEWLTLTNYLAANGYGYNGNVNQLAKSIASKTLWLSDPVPGVVGNDPESNNSSGFNGLPAGLRNTPFSYFNSINLTGYWWTATEDNLGEEAWARWIIYRYNYIAKDRILYRTGLSVRCIKNATTQVDDSEHDQQIKMYPNPAIDMMYIDIAEVQNVKMQICNVIGQYFLERELNGGINDIDISSLSKGIYIVKISGSDWMTQRKLIKE